MSGQPIAAQILQRCIGALEQEEVKVKLYELVQPAADHLYNKLMPYGCILFVQVIRRRLNEFVQFYLHFLLLQRTYASLEDLGGYGLPAHFADSCEDETGGEPR